MLHEEIGLYALIYRMSMDGDRLIVPPAQHDPAEVDDRRELNGILYILRTGSPWRNLL